MQLPSLPEKEQKHIVSSYLEMVRLNNPSNLEELKDLIYSTKIKYDVWGLTFPLWGTLGLANLKRHYLISREYYESQRTSNY